MDPARQERGAQQQELQLCVLGELTVLREAQTQTLPRSKKTRALLAYLALTARPHRRDRLCRLLWSIPEDPRAALRWSLTHLRRLVDEPGCARIIANRDFVAFERNRVAIDVVAVRASLPADLGAASTAALRQAVAAFRGDLLEGLNLPDYHEFNSWCIAEREEARRLRSRLLAALIGRFEAEPETALPYARERALLEPDDEVAQAALVTLLRAAGRSREAEAQFTSADRRLNQFGTARTGALRRARRGVPERDGDRVVSLALASVAPSRTPARPPAAQRPVQFCRTPDGVRIAYATVGNGPPLVRAAHWLGHLEFERHSPVWRHWTAEFSREHTFIRYDERGSGLSEWDVAELSLEGFVRDLEAVVDALGLDRFPLIGSSKGGPTAIAYAVRHPERVSHLVLLGSFAQGWCKRGDEAEVARREALITLTRQGWTEDNPAYRQIFTTRFMPDAGPEQFQWFNELQRVTSTAENALRLMRASGDTDVVALLPQVQVPTLVLHLHNDGSVPFEQGRLIASRIPGARFVALKGRNHIILPHEPAWQHFVAELRGFLIQHGTSPARSRARF
jgi:pimeloyl-ACP methyl ester carboxylesterase/DNA-binding SARP family transcriptional activator